MNTLRIYAIISLLATPLWTFAQYESKKVEINNDEYQGNAEVCTNCKTLPLAANKTYYWLKDGKVGNSKGSFQGELLHGKLELFAEGFEGKEMISEGNYYTGLKDGTIKNYILGGILETEEVFDKGLVKSIAYYTGDEDPSKNQVVRKFEYSLYSTSKSKITMTYLGTDSKIVGEGYQIPNGTNFSNFYDGKFQKFFLDNNGKEYLKEEGTFVKNRKNGNWKIYYESGIVATLQYDNDLLISEKFSQNGQPFSGTVKDMSPTKVVERAVIEVKNGIRNGVSKDSFRRDKDKNWQANRSITYENGKATNTIENLQTFLSSNAVVSTKELCRQCDQRGNDLYIDRIQYTKDGALVYFHHYNDSPNGATSLIYTAPIGDPTGFSAIDVNTQEIFKVAHIFQLAIEPGFNVSYNGEVTSIALFFEGLQPKHTKISFVEGDAKNPYVIDENGNTTTSWGCYDIEVK